MNKSTVLLNKSWDLLRPIVDGHWDKEKCYNGLALFVKGVYESQGHACIPTNMFPRMGELMRIVQEKLPWVMANGRRQQADDNPARYALRVAFNCVCLLLVSGMTLGTEAAQSAAVQQDNAEMLDRALMWGAGAVDKLGGPRLHEGSLSGEDAAMIARLATAAANGDVQRVVATVPHSLMALYMLQVLYDSELRMVKWVMLYVAVRCAKEAYTRARLAGDRAAQAPARAAWLAHTAGLAALDPDGPLAAFMVAEAKSGSGGSTPDTLRAMRKAARAAEERGDDLLAWLAHLNVALVVMYGGEGKGGTFSEDAVLQALDSAAAQRSSVSRWGGTLLLDNRCRAIKEDIMRKLTESRELARKRREGDSSGAAGSAPPLPEGMLPLPSASNKWGVTPPVPLEPRECGGCRKYFHKAMQCGRCRQVWYCSRECQTASWKAGHKNECAQMAAAAAAEGRAPDRNEPDD